VVAWFDQGGALKVSGDERSEVYLKGLRVVPDLCDAATDAGLAEDRDSARLVAACELILEGLAAEKRISRNEEVGYTRAKPERREPGGGYQKGLGLG
jgi:hypothetical protein